MNKTIKKFEDKYGKQEVKLPKPIEVINDSHPSPFSSGSNGYITKLRVKDGKLEYYLNWWAYGWYDANDGKYPQAIEIALKQVL